MLVTRLVVEMKEMPPSPHVNFLLKDNANLATIVDFLMKLVVAVDGVEHPVSVEAVLHRIHRRLADQGDDRVDLSALFVCRTNGVSDFEIIHLS